MAGQTGNERKKKLKGAGRFFSYKRQFFVCEKKKKDSEAFDFDHCYSQLRRLLFVLISPRSIEYLLHVW